MTELLTQTPIEIRSTTRQRKNLLWVVPVFQSVYPKPFGNFLAQAISTHLIADRYQICVHVPERELLHGAMNKAVQLLLAHDFEAMVMSDDDCFPPFDAIPRLVKHLEDGKDIVAALGFMRNFPHTTTVGRYYPEGLTLVSRPDGRADLTGFEWIEDVASEPEDLIRADFCGFPIAIVSRRAFEKITPPWFGTHINGGGCTHDVYFGVKAKEADLPIYVDRTIPCGHLAEAPVLTLENRMAIRAVQAQIDAASRRAEAEAARAKAAAV